MRGTTSDSGRRTLSKLSEKFAEPLFPFSIVSSPTVRSPILLPLSPKIIPTHSCALHFCREEILELFLGVLLLFLDARCSNFARTFSTVLVESFAARRNRWKEHITWVRDEKGKGCVPWM